MRAARDIVASGAVQGVGFRWTAKRIADALGVDGWVRNNPDGTVSMALEGTDAAMDDFLARLVDAFGGNMVSVKSRIGEPGKNTNGFDIVR